MITSQEAQRYDYEAFKSAWARAIERSGVKGLHFNDLRAKALTDTEERLGMQAARRKGAHSTEAQTADHVRPCGIGRRRRARQRADSQPGRTRMSKACSGSLAL